MKYLLVLVVRVALGFAFQFCPMNGQIVNACPFLAKLSCTCGCGKCVGCECNPQEKCSTDCKCNLANNKK